MCCSSLVHRMEAGAVLLQSIGFDMDYTLSQYRPETFEVLAYNLTVEKLVKNFHYPKVCLWTYGACEQHSPTHPLMVLFAATCGFT